MISISANGFTVSAVVAGDSLTFPDQPSYFDALPFVEAWHRGEFSEVSQDARLLPDWDRLLNRLLSGDLYPLFQAITLAAFSNPLVLIARNDIYGAISNPKISDRLGALKAGLDILSQSGYTASPEHKALWNQAIAELNFPDEVKI